MNPNSKLWLCQTNLENDYKNTLTFSTKADQRNYFIGNPSDPTSFGVSTKSYSDYTYLRLEQSIKVDDFIENIDTNNYLVLLNNNKYYYYFITSMSYVDDETTKIHIELDVMQTYFFDINYTESFIEREHVTDDVAGNHTLPEGLDLGDYVYASDPVDLNSYNTGTYICVQATELLDEVDYEDMYKKTVNGIYQGCYFMICTDEQFASNLIRIYDIEGKADAIISVFLVPKEFAILDVTTAIVGSVAGLSYSFLIPTTWDTYNKLVTGFTITRNTSLNGSYTPRNKKLLTHPFNFVNLTNNAGTDIVFRYEDFTSGNPKFDIVGDLTPSCSIRCIPKNYKGSTDDANNTTTFKSSNFGITGAKLPVCCWGSDTYTNWLTQKGLDTPVNTLLNLGKIGVGALTLGNPFLGGSLIASGVGDIIQTMGEKEQAKELPDQTRGNTNCGEINYSIGKAVFTAYKMSIKKENAIIIDKFFDMFGYKVNILKTPSIHTRRYWNYLKTRNCNFTGNIPQEYMVKIKTIFNNGITFWHDPSKMFDYSQTNSVLT